MNPNRLINPLSTARCGIWSVECQWFRYPRNVSETPLRAFPCVYLATPLYLSLLFGLTHGPLSRSHSNAASRLPEPTLGEAAPRNRPYPKEPPVTLIIGRSRILK